VRARLVLFALIAAAACRARAPDPDPSLLRARESELGVRTASIAHAPRPLRLGLIPVYSPETMIHQYSALASYLGEELSTVVELVIPESYEASIADVVAGRFDAVQLSPLAYVVAKERAPSLELLATNISEGSSTYSGFILARAADNLSTLSDLRGKRLGLVDKSSASGYLFPYAFFLDHGVDPSQFFPQIVMTKRHDLVIKGLLEKKFDLAATFSGAMLTEGESGLDVDQLQIVAKTGRIPYDAWCVRAELQPLVKSRIRDALLALSTRTSEGRKRLAPLKTINAFTIASDSEYDEIRRVKRMVEEATD
jgi:phosphate/phosphite/phosphonate ABC transporter binding protein